LGDTHPGEHEAARLSAKPTGGSVEALVIGAPEQVAVMTEACGRGSVGAHITRRGLPGVMTTVV